MFQHPTLRADAPLFSIPALPAAPPTVTISVEELQRQMDTRRLPITEIENLYSRPPQTRNNATSVLSLNYRDSLRFERRPSPLIGEGLGGGAGAAAKALQRRTLKPTEPVSCRCVMLVPRS